MSCAFAADVSPMDLAFHIPVLFRMSGVDLSMLRRIVMSLVLSLPMLVWAERFDLAALSSVPHVEPLPSRIDLGPGIAPAIRPPFKVQVSASRARQGKLYLRSYAALVLSQDDGQLLYAKNHDAVLPIASITKLMTAIVILDSGLPLDDPITITREDLDRLKGTASRLGVGVALSRRDMLRLALMASENRAAAVLARTYPGGTEAFVETMNQKAKHVGMRNTHYVDATGLNPNNVSTARDLALLVSVGYRYALIREYSTAQLVRLHLQSKRMRRALAFRNSNGLIRSSQWEIGLQKTGYIKEAGRCLILQARIADRPVIIVLLHSWNGHTRIADANRLKRWVEALPAGRSTPAWYEPQAALNYSHNTIAESASGLHMLSMALARRWGVTATRNSLSPLPIFRCAFLENRFGAPIGMRVDVYSSQT
jgi:serine-type D-Ala-D-Ala endopeptidase (penicillin-binding protein 7)